MAKFEKRRLFENDCEDSFCARSARWVIEDERKIIHGRYCDAHVGEYLQVLREADNRASSDQNGK